MAQVLEPLHCVGDLEEAPGFWLQIGSTLAVTANWGVNQWMEALSLSLPLFLSLSLSLSASPLSV